MLVLILVILPFLIQMISIGNRISFIQKIGLTFLPLKSKSMPEYWRKSSRKERPLALCSSVWAISMSTRMLLIVKWPIARFLLTTLGVEASFLTKYRVA